MSGLALHRVSVTEAAKEKGGKQEADKSLLGSGFFEGDLDSRAALWFLATSLDLLNTVS